jgi:cellular nucleic acid-binding protein
MARSSVAMQLSGLAANPYPRPKEQMSIYTECELCKRTMLTRDWAGHKNSKKHRELEAKDKVEAEGTTDKPWGTDFDGFTGNATGNDSFGGGDTFGTNTTISNDVWGGSFDNNTARANTRNNIGGGGGDRACFGCGETGHTKRDCPQGGGGGDRACYGCGETGHQKRDCPKGGSGGGQACFNCGEVGYVVDATLNCLSY